MNSNIPENLLKFFADSEIEVVSWSASNGNLVLRVEKDIGRETGLLSFGGVGLTHLPPRFTAASLSSSTTAISEFPGVSPEKGEHLFFFEEAWGKAYFVMAESISYEIQA